MMKTGFAPFLFLIIALLVFTGCSEDDSKDQNYGDIDFRSEMRAFVSDLSAFAKEQQAGFLVIPQNGQELITDTGESDGEIQTDYLQSIDASGRENLFYGYDHDDTETPADDNEFLLELCQLCETNDVEVLVTDYCFTQAKVDNSYDMNGQYGFTSFAADERELNSIPDYPASPINVNSNDIDDISEIGNFLYLINSENYSSKQEFINAIAATDYDLVLIDLFFEENSYSAADITQLHSKANGGSRLVICYMSIGEAEDYRYYWQSAWNSDPPNWLDRENPDWAGNYKVRYWDENWQDLIYGGDDSYLQKIINAGFNGVYLDIIDAFEFFED
jgi:cysteinyl-tRNA synthetase, unknown class